MTNYNDGKWHGWNGGECPVHPRSRVDGMEPRCVFWDCHAEDCDWPSFRGAFRVTKEHKKPREYWICLDYSGNLLDFQKEKPDDTYGYFRVEEV